MTDITIATTFVVNACATCGALCAIPDETDDQLRRNGRTFYCTNGHCMVYGDNTEKQLRDAKDRLAREQARNDQLRADRDAEKRKAAAARGQVTDHMASQHPSFVKDTEAAAGGVTG